MKKILLILNGESFRHGHQGSRNRGNEISIDLQKVAIDSQIHFIEFLKEKYNINCDIFLNTYTLNSLLDSKIVSWYGPYLKYLNWNEGLLGETGLYDKSIEYIKNNIKYDDYDSFLILRPEHFLKKYFSEIFNPKENKILFASINEITDPKGLSYHKINDEIPAVNHQIMYIPNSFIKSFLNGEIFDKHYSYARSLKFLKKEDIGFFIYTYHSSSTDSTWNPIFHQIGRYETDFWVDEKFIVDDKTHKPIHSDVNIYFNLKNNNFKDEYPELHKLMEPNPYYITKK